MDANAPGPLTGNDPNGPNANITDPDQKLSSIGAEFAESLCRPCVTARDAGSMSDAKRTIRAAAYASHPMQG